MPPDLKRHQIAAMLAELSAISVTDFSIGESGSIKPAAAPTPTQQKAFDRLDINPIKLFPAAGR